MPKRKLTALLELDEAGELTGIFPNAGSDEEMEILKNILQRLFERGRQEREYRHD